MEGMNVMKESKLYCCFSKPQRDFLIANGINPEIKAKNCNTDCTMWVFIKTDKLKELLKQWSLGKKA